MKYKYAIIGLDVDQKHLEEILNILEEGYVIISSQSTRNHVHYILEKNEERKNKLSDYLENINDNEDPGWYTGGDDDSNV